MVLSDIPTALIADAIDRYGSRGRGKDSEVRRVGPVSWSSDVILDKLLNELSAPLSCQTTALWP